MLIITTLIIHRSVYVTDGGTTPYRSDLNAFFPLEICLFFCWNMHISVVSYAKLHLTTRS
jgi:hypothetical protein